MNIFGHPSDVPADAQKEIVFVARQPIFDARQNVVAYEVLYRNSASNSFDGTDGTIATLNVIRNAFLVLGPQLVGSKRAFINFNKTLLERKTALSLNPASTVIEILEDVETSKEVVTACRELKKAGYAIALDDFALSAPGRGELLELADIIKADFRQMSPEERRDLVSKSRLSCQFLAEKVETHEEFNEAVKAGYTYFQGFFFGRPVILSANAVSGNKINYLSMLSEINKPELDFMRIEKLIKQDTYLGYTLLNYMNSAFFGFRHHISSIRQALTLLGEREIQRWASLVMMTFIGADRPSEVNVSSLVRAKFCETIAPMVGLADRSSELFMTGMFSMIDVLIGRPMDEILQKMNVSDDVKGALLGDDNRFSRILDLVVPYERAQWQEFETRAKGLVLDEAVVPAIYGNSIDWAEQVFGIHSAVKSA